MLSLRKSRWHAAALAVIGYACVGVPALADAPAAKPTLLPDTSIVVLESNGKSTVIPIDEKLAKRLLADTQATPLSASVVVFSANNKTYMIRDHQMPDGEMMIASILRDYVPPGGGG